MSILFCRLIERFVITLIKRNSENNQTDDIKFLAKIFKALLKNILQNEGKEIAAIILTCDKLSDLIKKDCPEEIFRFYDALIESAS